MNFQKFASYLCFIMTYFRIENEFGKHALEVKTVETVQSNFLVITNVRTLVQNFRWVINNKNTSLKLLSYYIWNNGPLMRTKSWQLLYMCQGDPAF